MTALYRVWCLSWDDTEEDGKDVVAVDILKAIGKPPPTRRDPIEVYYQLDAESAAEEYADYAHDSRDGNECTWPLVFRVRGPDGALQDFEVVRDFDPTFRATPVKQPGARHG